MSAPSPVLLRPRPLLRLEGIAVLIAAVAWYWAIDGGWGLFALTFLAPDLAFLGFLAGARAGTAAYNLAHTYALPAGLAVLAVIGASRPAGLAALIWMAHIGFDRALGFGLKYDGDPKDTHFKRL